MQSPRDQSPIKRSSYHFLSWERSSRAEEALHMGIRPIPRSRLFGGGVSPRGGRGARAPLSQQPGAIGVTCSQVGSTRACWAFLPLLLLLLLLPGPQCYSRALPARRCPVGGEGRGAMSDASTKITLWPRSRVHAQPLRQRKRGEEGSEAA